MPAPTSIAVPQRRYRLDLNMGTDLSADWQQVIGLTEFKPDIPPEIVTLEPYESDGWPEQVVTGRRWSLEFKLARRVDSVTDAFNPTHEELRTASAEAGVGTFVNVRWYDREGRPEAYAGYGVVAWAPEGGDGKAVDLVAVTITGSGPLESISNPVV